MTLFALLSGFTGLVYEVLWAKHLAWTLGGTALAQATTLAVFLAGLSAGSSLLGPLADREEIPLRLYASLEAGIGLLGLLAPWAMAWPGGLTLMLLSSFLMGGILPCLGRAAAPDLPGLTASFSRLYCLNTLGAAAGALAAGFFLIPLFGLDRACWAAAALDLTLAGLASRLGKPVRADRAEEPADAGGPGLPLLLSLVAVSGSLTLAYEVGWTRLLCLTLGSSVYSFCVMLAALLCGFSLGGWLLAKRRPSVPAWRLFAYAQFGIAGALILTLPLYEGLPYVFLRISAVLPKTGAGFYLHEGLKFALCLALMLPPGAFIGMALPLACRAAARSERRLASGLGWALGAGSLGNVAGAMAASLWLLPGLGLRGLFTAGIAANLAVAAILLRTLRAAALGLCLLVLHLSIGSWDPIVFAFSSGRLAPLPELGFHGYWKMMRRFTLLSHEDDREATVAVVGLPGDTRSLVINGKADASDSQGDMRTQVLLAQLPLLLAPRRDKALVVGLGSGVTAGSALTHPLSRLDVAEISPAVVKGSAFFSENNRRPLEDPRTRLHVTDAGMLLRRSRERYDVIISEPSNPWMAGIGNLFSAEFYGAARARLAPGGLMVQWFHIYEMDDATLRLVLRTFSSAFSHASLWYTCSKDILLLGADQPFEPDLAALESRFMEPAVREDLSRVGITRLATLLSLQAASEATVRSWAGAGEVNAVRRPLLEYGAPKAAYLSSDVRLVPEGEDFLDPERRSGLLLSRYLSQRKTPLSDGERLGVLSAQDFQRRLFCRRWAEDWIRAAPRSPVARLALAGVLLQERAPAKALETLEPWLKERPKDAEFLDLAVRAAYADFEQTGSTESARRCLALGERLVRLGRGDAHETLGRVHQKRGELREAVGHFKKAAQATGEADLWMRVARLGLDLEDQALLLEGLGKALEIDPEHQDANDLMRVILTDKEPS
ncbi:MAG: hypothetical protein WC728_01980 [Elusimicrobiota bacterium]